MTLDINRTVDELDRVHADSNTTFILEALREWPHIYFELKRLWAVEQAAVRYRDIVKHQVSYVGLLATMESADAAESALFALLRAKVEP